MKKNFTLLLTAFLLSGTAFSQNLNDLIGNHLTKVNSNITDFAIIQNNYNDQIQANQLHIQRESQGIPVYGAYANYVLKNNQIVSTSYSSNFNLSLNEPSPTPSLSFLDAVSAFSKNENLKLFKTNHHDTALTAEGIYLFEEDSPQLIYFVDDQKNTHLSYLFTAKIKDKDHAIYDIIIDANTGKTLEKHSQSLSCGFNHESFFNENLATFNQADWNWLYDSAETNTTNYYNVYQLPLEAPTFGARSSYQVNAFNPTASPFGWHDTNGVEGNDFTVTRGNNTRTVHDIQSIGYTTYNGANATTTGYVEGGPNLVFDFPYDNTRHPYIYKEASATNLFYMNNMMHDIYYRYGFTEAFGNFQQNNYGKGGTANDPVIALAQTGMEKGESNNATFSTPIDGRSPLMSMYLWSAPSSFNGKPLTLHSPTVLAGDYSGLTGNFGPELPVAPLTRNFVLVRKTEATGTPYDGCGTISNASELNDKIAIVLRGDCPFVQKVQSAQDAGAAAVIVVNNAAGTISMGGESTTITIPSISVTAADGNQIVSTLENNTPISGSLKYIEIPYIDGSFDNGIIAHEYGHGISTRQTGPVSNSSCLNNKEQMGEGWSDFFGLMITQLPTDTSTTRRGIGTFAVNQAKTGVGIRPTVYTTNMTQNPSTYANLVAYGNADSPHRTGYVWATMLWDLNWKMINKYGFTPDLINGNAGNTKAISLVMEGLRLQPCRPGFVDGRNAILEADQLLNNGENKCDIWSVFARRGLGYSASQGDSNDRTDGVAAYDLPPTDVLNCELKTTDLQTESFKLFPNPTKDVVHFYDETIKEDVKVEIIDMVGQVVHQETLKLTNHKNSVNTSKLPKGVYILKFHTTAGTISKKLIKN